MAEAESAGLAVPVQRLCWSREELSRRRATTQRHFPPPTSCSRSTRSHHHDEPSCVRRTRSQAQDSVQHRPQGRLAPLHRLGRGRVGGRGDRHPRALSSPSLCARVCVCQQLTMHCNSSRCATPLRSRTSPPPTRARAAPPRPPTTPRSRPTHSLRRTSRTSLSPRRPSKRTTATRARALPSLCVHLSLPGPRPRPWAHARLARLQLNKFCVTPRHFLLVTKEFRKQTTPLSPLETFTAWSILKQLGSREKHLAFFNCGDESGASSVPFPLRGSLLRLSLTPVSPSRSQPTAQAVRARPLLVSPWPS